MSKRRAALIVALLASTALAGCSTPSQEEADSESVDTASIDPTVGTSVAPSAPPAAKSTPARLELLDATVSATQVHPNDVVSLRFEVENVGSKDGSFAIQLLVNGEVYVEKSYRVAAGAPETGSLDFRPSQSGTYTLSLASSVLGESGRTQAFSKSFNIKVSIPANLQVIDASSSH